MKIAFFGAAGEVTGSQHLIETRSIRILLDCGLFQGHRTDTRAKNENFLAIHENWTAWSCRMNTSITVEDYPVCIVPDFGRPSSALVQQPTWPKSCSKTAPKFRPKISGIFRIIRSQDFRPSSRCTKENTSRKVVNLFEPLEFGQWHELSYHFRLRFSDAGHSRN